MTREDLKDIICKVIARLADEESPRPACLYADQPDPEPCDVTTRYAIGEEG